jgi:exosortase/archaeosortase family protein
MRSAPSFSHRAAFLRPALTGLFAAALGGALLGFFPSLELDVFSKGAAYLAGLLTGSPTLRVAEGWILPSDARPVVVTSACSASHYYLIVAFVVSTHLCRRGKPPLFAGLGGLLLAFPVCLLVNALRVITVTQVHRWIIPRLPEAYGPFLHLLTGVAIFLPALIALNLLMETYARPSPTA